ncbi:MAG: sorbosone dehydrogenase family protein [Ginsengibacter sp.]
MKFTVLKPGKIFNFLIATFTFCTIWSCNSGNNETAKTENNADTTSQQTSDLYKKYNLDKVTLPPGFSINIFAQAEGARSLCVSPNGTIFVGSQNAGKVYAMRDDNHDGKADKVYTIVKGFDTPNGVAFKDGSLFVATVSTIYRLDSIESRLDNPPSPVMVYDKYPTDKHHGWKFIAFGPDGKLYVPVGAPCNICEPEKPIYASITRINSDGTGLEIFAKGIRNSVGFDWNPVTKELWFTDNGRDDMGDDVPNDELNNAPKAGMNFGYPYCHQGNVPDPEFGKGKDCNNYTPPVKLMGPHNAALGMRFYTGSMFPAEYKNAIFVARHGSWNRSIPVGYNVAVLKMDADGKFTDPAPFANGWLQNEHKVNGRPVDVSFLEDGSMLVSDDYNGLVYRISYTPTP